MAFNPATDISSLAGKVILITGGKGIGGATVKLLAEHNPSKIFICARSHPDDLISQLAEKHPKVEIHFYPMDLASLESVKRYAAEFDKSNDRLDLLFLNSGISTTAPELTKEGYQSQLGINHLGHALLTQLLLPTLLRTASSAQPGSVRIMVTSSVAHKDVWGKAFDPSSDNARNADAYGSAVTRYGHSKLANILFARALAQKYPSLISTSYHPGVVKTEIWKKDEGNPYFMAFMRPFVSLLGRSVENGAWTGLFLATQSNVHNGAYYEPIGVEKPGSKYSREQREVDACWEWTEKELRLYNGGMGWPEV